MAAGCVTIQHSQGCDTTVQARDTTRKRVWVRTTIQPAQAYYMVPLRATTRRSARAVGAQCAQPGPPCGQPGQLGVHLCTQQFFDSVHCF